MAQVELRLTENAPGDFFVDSTCIDCDLCRQIAPEVFSDIGEQSVVHRQPRTPAEEFSALKALVTCPTASIGAVGHSAKAAAVAYPEPVEDGVFFCGFASRDSFGASSYLIQRPGGNVLIDSPRFARPLVNRIEQMGGISWMLLTHRDDVADHERWASHFGAARMIHKDDAGGALAAVEHKVEGHDAVTIDDDLAVIPTPGHTRGHVVFLYRDKYLFTGDHLWWSPARRSLSASLNVCWYSWAEQTRSMERLLDYEFEWVLPGHGRRANFPADEMRRQLLRVIERMKAQTRRSG